LNQKLYILELVSTEQLFRLQTQFPQALQKQIDERLSKIKEVLLQQQTTKITLHKEPPLNYSKLYQFLYQVIKD